MMHAARIVLSPPDLSRDQLIGYACEEVKSRLRQRIGRSVSRQTLHTWATQGLPIVTKRVYLVFPTSMSAGRRMTSREALDRFFSALKNVRREIDEMGGDVVGWMQTQEIKRNAGLPRGNRGGPASIIQR